VKRLVIPFLLVLSSCSANWHLKRAIKKDPTIIKESIVELRDTVIVEVPAKDLNGSLDIGFDLPSIDTTFRDQGVTTRVFTTSDSINILKVETKCPGDTIYVDREITVDCPPRIEYVQGKTTWGMRATWALIGAVLCLFLYKRL
jgi:hypothetical protein